jgi:uncharacterized protein YqhQ
MGDMSITSDPKVEQLKQKTRNSAEARRSEIVAQMNAKRPKPAMNLTPKPPGVTVQKVHTAEAQKKNAEIDKNIENFKAKVRENKGKARDSFDRSR